MYERVKGAHICKDSKNHSITRDDIILRAHRIFQPLSSNEGIIPIENQGSAWNIYLKSVMCSNFDKQTATFLSHIFPLTIEVC